MIEKKRVLLLLLIFVFFVPTVLAASYDKWVVAGEDISFDNTVFTTAINPRWDIATIGFDSELFLIGKGECQASALYRVCFNDTRFDVVKGYGVYNVTTDTMTPELHIIISTLTPTVEITRTIDKTQLLINDVATISVKVANEGEKKVYDLEYIDVIPNEFTIIERKGVVSDGNAIKWIWPSLSGETSFSYKIKLIKPINVSWKASLSYVFESKSVFKNTSSITVKKIEATNPLNVERSLSPTNIKVGEDTLYIITLKNTDEKNDVEVESFVVSIPKKVEIKGYGELKKDQNDLSWSGVMGPATNKTFEVELKCDYTGEYKINISLENSFYNEIEKKTHTKLQNYSNTLKSDFTRLEPSVKFMFDKKTLNYDDESNIRAFIENKDSKIPLFEVEFEVKSELFDDFENTLEHILPGQKVEAFYYPFRTPSLFEDKVYKVKFSGRYRTVYYEYFNFSSEGSITVKKDPDAVFEDEEQQTIEEEQEVEQTSNESLQEDIVVEKNESGEPLIQKKENFFVKFFKALASLIKDLF